ncbi:hypothetical protein J6590_050760 [Homalodisca vitripennis]|nr:hypothetical protein J6590_050760 [Homalodisca vitripennis]
MAAIVPSLAATERTSDVVHRGSEIEEAPSNRPPAAPICESESVYHGECFAWETSSITI